MMGHERGRIGHEGRGMGHVVMRGHCSCMHMVLGK